MSESMFLTKEMLLSTQDELVIEKVDLMNAKGDIRGHVFVREMTAKEKDTWEASLRKELPSLGNGKGANAQPEMTLNLADTRVKLAICAMCDQRGERIFDMTPATIKKLGEQVSATNMERIADAINRINKLTPEAKEETLKNSEADQNDSSSSDSAEN